MTCLWENLEGVRFFCSLEKVGVRWVAWVQVEGGREEARRWKSNIRIQAASRADTTLTHSGTVAAVDEEREEIINNEELCFSLTNEDVKKLKDLSVTEDQKSEGYCGKITVQFSVEDVKDYKL